MSSGSVRTFACNDRVAVADSSGHQRLARVIAGPFPDYVAALAALPADARIPIAEVDRLLAERGLPPFDPARPFYLIRLMGCGSGLVIAADDLREVA